MVATKITAGGLQRGRGADQEGYRPGARNFAFIEVSVITVVRNRGLRLDRLGQQHRVEPEGVWLSPNQPSVVLAGVLIYRFWHSQRSVSSLKVEPCCNLANSPFLIS